MTHGGRTLLLALAVGLPGTLAATALVWTGDYSAKVLWTVTVFGVGLWLAFAWALRSYAVRPLQTVSNLLAALREGNYTQRGTLGRRDDEVGLVIWEINKLGEAMREERLGAIEASVLLRQVMAEIDVAVFAFDHDGKLLLSNRAGEKLLGKPTRELVGTHASELGMAQCLEGKTPRTIEAEFAGATGRWELSRNPIRQGGLRHQLVVLSNVQRALREQERQAWKRLIRVLSHEINNSLAPIQSIAGSLSPSSDPDDLRRGLDVIRGRSEGLGRFMASYTRLAKLPPPRMKPVEVRDWIQRVAELDERMRVAIKNGPDVTIPGDGDQLDQLLINLIRNAVDASLETSGAVEVGWKLNHQRIEIFVADEGPGIESTQNLFVPFFTTKPDGTGIGLALSRQIAEAHDGTLTLQNRHDRPGCIARLHLPIAG